MSSADTIARPPDPVRLIVVDELSFGVVSSSPVGVPVGPPTVLVHGIGMSHRYLRRLHRELALDRAVHSVDLPGFGGLPTPDGDGPIGAFAAALATIVAALEAGPVVLVGQSMGSQWVVELARTRPDLVSHVVVIGPVADDRHRSLGAQARALALDALREPPGTNAILLADYLRCGMRWYLTQLRHMLSYRIEDAVAELRMPLLVLRGGHDPIAGAGWCRRLGDRAPAAAVVTVPRGAHNVQRSVPRAVADAIRFHTDPGRSR